MPRPVAWSTAELAEGSRADPDLTVRVRRLTIAVVLALLLVGGLATILVAEHHQSVDERAATSTVTAWVDAANAHDVHALQQVSTAQAVWEAVGQGKVVVGPYAGPAYSTWFRGLFAQGFRIDVQGPPIVSGDAEVAWSTRLRLAGTFFGITVPYPREASLDETGVTEFHLVRVGGQLKVAEVVWLPPY